MNKFAFIKILLSVLLLISISLPAQAKKKKKIISKRPITHSVSDAIKRSDVEQKKIRVKLDFEQDERFQTWNQRKQEAIRIKHTGGSSIQPMDIGSPDFSMDDVGEDQSGLNNLKRTVDEESTDIDFDAELREVSSNKK